MLSSSYEIKVDPMFKITVISILILCVCEGYSQPLEESHDATTIVNNSAIDSLITLKEEKINMLEKILNENSRYQIYYYGTIGLLIVLGVVIINLDYLFVTIPLPRFS